MATGLGRLAFSIGGCPSRTLQNFPKPLVYKNFSQRVKRRKQTVAKTSVDIDGILSSTSTKKVTTATTNDPASVSPKDETMKTWQTSEERTNLLKQGERRVAIIAVVTMLIAFGVIKLMVYGADKKRKSEAVEQPA